MQVVTKSQNPSHQTQYAQDLRYNVISKSFDVGLGGVAFQQWVDTQGTEGHGPASSHWTINPSNPLSNDPSVLDGLTAINTQYLKNTSLALFGQLSWKVSDSVSIQPGLRLT